MRGSYDGPVLSITVPGRRIHLADIRDAATAIYGAAVRTPLVRLDLSDAAGSPFELYLNSRAMRLVAERARMIAEGAAGCAVAAAVSVTVPAAVKSSAVVGRQHRSLAVRVARRGVRQSRPRCFRLALTL